MHRFRRTEVLCADLCIYPIAFRNAPWSDTWRLCYFVGVSLGWWWAGVTKITGRIAISISKPNGLVDFRLASAPKKAKKTNLKPTDKDNPKQIRRSEFLRKLFATSYVFNQVLYVSLHGQMLVVWFLSWISLTVFLALRK